MNSAAGITRRHCLKIAGAGALGARAFAVQTEPLAAKARKNIRLVIGTIDRAERLLREIASPCLKITLDPANFFRPQDLPDTKPMLGAMFRRLGPNTVMAHAKDVRVTGDKLEYPPAGQGMIDYPTFLRLLVELDRPIDLLLEYVKREDVSRVVTFLRGVLEKLP